VRLHEAESPLRQRRIRDRGGDGRLVEAATRVGANDLEADDAVSMKDFRHKISICKREAREAKFFLRMMAKAVPEVKDEARPLWQEAKELHLIFAKIYRG
jgi:four helix bundle protein